MKNVEINKELEKMIAECRHYIKDGAVASYIPELAKADPEKIGVYLIGAEVE